jgi:hypothetical protein
METNLDGFFKTDAKSETEGVWFDYPNGAKFLIRRFGGLNSTKTKAIIASHFKPYARKIEMGTLSPEKDKEISVTVFVKSCLIDWSGVVLDKADQKYSEEKAVELLLLLPALYEDLVKQASNIENYKVELGNS